MQNNFKNLAIISDCVHAYDRSKKVITENHIFCRQMQSLASMFEHTVICCPFTRYSPDMVTTSYSNPDINFIALPLVGGNRLKDKLIILKTIPVWLKTFRKISKNTDIVYQRFPNNLNIPGFFFFWLIRKKTFATYTGTWKNYEGEPLTFRFQKWLLKNFFRGPVAAYITDNNIGKRIFKSFSPSYTLTEWEEETAQVNSRMERQENCPLHKPVFITVGALVANKNQQYILDAFKILHDEGFRFYLYVVGDGPLMYAYKQFIDKNNLQQSITLTGNITYTDLRILYRRADFLIQATLAEGYGKAPIEGFFHGVIPFLSNTAMAKEMTGNNERGFIFSTSQNNLANLIRDITNQTAIIPGMIKCGRQYARQMTLENWTAACIKIVNEYYS